MRRILVILLVAGLVLAPFSASLYAKSSSSKSPPIEQPLVSEGEFALELATALNLTSSHDEAAAVNSLATINIAPRNGWLSDYPMTPDILAEVRDSAARATSSGSLNMSETEATAAVDGVGTAMNLPIKIAGGKARGARSGSQEQYSSESSYSSSSSTSSEYESSSAAPPPETSEYVEPSAVEQYYDEYGPPIVSYYPPPWEYGYLYNWVPYPFWWGGFAFGGFFILGDFHCHHHNHWYSNHVTHANGTVSRVNAVTRASGRGVGSSTVAGAGRSSGQGTRFNSANAQAGARTIMNRQAAAKAGNTTGAAAASRNVSSSGASRSMGSANSSMRNPVAATRSMNTFANNGNRAGTMSRGSVSGSASYSGSYRNSGTMSGYRNSAMGGYRSSGTGGFRGSSSFGGFHGGGGGFHGGGGHR